MPAGIEPEGKYFQHDSIQTKSENKIYQNGESSADRAFYQFDAYPDLRIPYLIQWINEHPQYANAPEYAEEIFLDFSAIMPC